MNQIVPKPSCRGLCAIVLILILCLTTSVSATPQSSSDDKYEYEEGTVYIEAHVPDDFRGSVSAQLRNTESNELHTVTCYHAGRYKNNISIPTGDYAVERAFTSEDSFVYEAFTEIYEFSLEASETLTVDVEYNERAQAYLEEQTAGKEQESTDDSATDESSLSISENTSSAGNSSSSVSSPESVESSEREDVSQDDLMTGKQSSGNEETDGSTVSSSDTTTPDTADDSDNPDKVNRVMDSVRYIGKVLFGTAIFAGIVLGSIYVIRHKTKD